MDMKNLDVCPMIDTIEKIGFFSGYLDWANKTFPGLVKKCPYNELIVTNATYHIPTKEEQSRVHMNPNGIVKSEFYSSYPVE